MPDEKMAYETVSMTATISINLHLALTLGLFVFRWCHEGNKLIILSIRIESTVKLRIVKLTLERRRF